MPVRRPLAFSSLDDVMPDVDRLLAGHQTVGTWSLGQICNHLALSLRYSAEGGLPVRISWLTRLLVGTPAKWHVFRTGALPAGFKVPSPVLVPAPDRDDRAEAEALRATIRLYLAAPEPFPPHPLFGPLSPEEWRRFHCIHCAHHLSFALPEPG